MTKLSYSSTGVNYHLMDPLKQLAQLAGTQTDKNIVRAGFAVFVPQSEVKAVLAIAKKQGIKAYHAGVVEKGEKQVIIEPLGVIFSGDSLQVRA